VLLGSFLSFFFWFTIWCLGKGGVGRNHIPSYPLFSPLLSFAHLMIYENVHTLIIYLHLCAWLGLAGWGLGLGCRNYGLGIYACVFFFKL
jgi:hypothetical protein